MQLRLLVSCIASAGLLAGCTALRPAAPAIAPAELPAVAELDAALQQRRDAMHSLRALAHLRYRDPHESSSTRQAIVVQRPDRVRVEVLSVFSTVFLLTADGDAITAYVPQERSLYRGPATPENLWRYTRLWLPVRDLVDIVLATPEVPANRSGSVAFDPQTGWIRLQHDTDRGQRAVWFGAERVPMAVEQRNLDGELSWQTRYTDYENKDGLAIATHIALDLPRWSRSMNLELEDIDLNPTLNRDLFALQPPPGTTVVPLESNVD